MTPSRRWEHIRGVLILVHILAICLMALPAPQGGMRKDAWKEPTVQDEIMALSERLNSLGYENTPEELEAELWVLATDVISIRKQVLRPFDPYARYMGTQQSWRMFVAPHRYPARLHVEIRRPGEDWELVSIFQDPSLFWGLVAQTVVQSSLQLVTSDLSVQTWFSHCWPEGHDSPPHSPSPWHLPSPSLMHLLGSPHGVSCRPTWRHCLTPSSVSHIHSQHWVMGRP